MKKTSLAVFAILASLAGAAFADVVPVQYYDYISFTGTQRIKLDDVFVSPLTRLEMDVSFPAKSEFKGTDTYGGNGNVFWAVHSEGGDAGQFTANFGSTQGGSLSLYFRFEVYASSNNKSVNETTLKARNTIKADRKNKSFAWGTYTQATSASSTGLTLDTPLYLFGTTNKTFTCYNPTKLYEVRIYEDDVLVKTLRPAMMSDGSGALCNTVTKKCYGNDGTGNFGFGTSGDLVDT